MGFSGRCITPACGNHDHWRALVLCTRCRVGAWLLLTVRQTTTGAASCEVFWYPTDRFLRTLLSFLIEERYFRLVDSDFIRKVVLLGDFLHDTEVLWCDCEMRIWGRGPYIVNMITWNNFKGAIVKGIILVFISVDWPIFACSTHVWKLISPR